MKKILLCLIATLIYATAVSAFTVTPTGAIVEIKYTEPLDNTDGSPVTDLSHCTLYYDTGQGVVKAKDFPASSPSGGAEITTSYEVPWTGGQEFNVRFWMTASDLSGNESGASVEKVIRIDKLAPNAPR